jgi:rhodanese-related sulfurtransferase
MPTTASREARAEEITQEELLRRLDDPDLRLVDVLPPESFAARHIRGARNLPAGQARVRAREVLPDPAREVVVYCGGFT